MKEILPYETTTWKNLEEICHVEYRQVKSEGQTKGGQRDTSPP
jgi:hypothetical protein